MSKAAVNIHLKIFVWTSVSVSLCNYLKVELLHHMLILYLTFGVRLFSSAAALFSFPPAVDEIYNSSTSLLALVIFQFFNVLLSGRKVVSLWFSFAFPRWLRMFSFFSCAYWSSRETFFGQVFVPLFCPFLFLISCFFLLLSFDSSIYILDPSPLSAM